MINLTIGTNTNRKSVLVDKDTALSTILEENGVSTASTALHLNGSLIALSELDNTLEELGVEDETNAMLIAVVKADSAR